MTVIEIAPTENYPSPRRLLFYAVRAHTGIEGDPIDEVCYQVLGSGCSPAWVSVASLRPFMQTGKIISS